MVAQRGHPTHSPLTAGSMPTLPSMASRKQDPPPSSTCCSHYVKHHPVPYPPFSSKYKEYLPPKPTKRKMCHFDTSLWLDNFNVQDTSWRPEAEEPVI